jgi:hypothetical protein
MNERTNPRDITSQASSSAAAPQEHLGGAHGVKPVAAPLTPAGAQPSVVVKARSASALRALGDELLDVLNDESTLVNDTEAADPAPVPAVDPTPVVAETAGAATTTTAPAALDAAGAGAATTGTAAAGTAAGATATGTAAATGGFFSTTAGIATMAGGGAVVLGAAAGGGSKAAPAPAPAPDTTKPAAPGVTLTTDSGSSATDTITNSAAISLSGIETAVGTKVEYKLDNAAAWSTTYTAPTTDGAHSLQVRQTDAAGNVSATVTTLSFTLDTTAPAAPTLALANAVAGAVTNSAALAAITPEAGATVEYRVDGGAWGAYTAPSAQGAHTVEARQVDVAGNVSALSSVNFTLDTVAPAAPVVALANGATALTNNAALTTVTPEAGALVEYRVDGGNWVGTYTAPTGDIAHTVDVRQTDAVGNVSALSTLSFTLDTQAPASVTPALANGATTLTNNAGLTALSATEAGATVEYRVDGGSWGAYTAPTAQGAHTVEARQVDAAGNVSAPSTPLAFTLDTQAPVAPGVALSNGNAAGTTTNNGSVTVTGVEAGATAEYRVTDITGTSAWAVLVADAQGVYNVPSPTIPGQTYTVEVRQTDAAGNVSTSLGSINFTLSSAGSAPSVGLVSDTGVVGDAITSVGQLQITPAADTAPNSTTIEYSTDGGRTWGPSFTPTANAVNVVEVRYNNPSDTTGNSATLPASFTFTLDTQVVAPTLSLQTGTSALTNSSAVTLGGVEAGALVEYSTDGITGWAVQQPAATQGSNTLYVRQTDVAGNVSAASTALSFNLDSVAPNAPGVVLANGATTLTNNAGLNVTNEPGASVEYNVDNSGWSATYTAPVGDIAHTVNVRQTDAAGNVSGTTSIAFTLDTVAPTAPVVALANGATSLTNNATLTAITPEAGALVEYSLNGSAWSPTYTAPTAATNGTAYTLDVRQTDTAGNVSASTALAFTLDNVAPAAPVVALANNATGLTNNATLAAITPEAGATVEYSVDGGAWSATYSTPTSNAAHTVDVHQIDAAGNVSAAGSLGFTLDTIAPVAPSLFASGTQTAISGTVTNSAIDLSGVEAGASVQYRVYTGATPSAWTPLVAVGGVYTVPSQPTSGLYTVDVQVTDAAGNTSSLSSASFNLQGTAGPVATLVSDTGISGDWVTSNSALNIPASATSSLSQVEYSADGSTGWTTTQPTWVEGLNTTHLRYADPTNATPPSLVTTLQFTLDTVTPDVSSSGLTYTPSTLAATQGTLVATVGLGANAAVGDTLTLTVAGASAQPVAKALSAADVAAGSVSITIDQATLTSGTPTSASAQITDLAGNTSAAVVSTTLAFDNVVATPSGLGLATDSGTVGDHLTNNATLAALTGVETGATVQYSVDGGINWSSNYTTPISGDGTAASQHSVMVRQIDAAGNLSAATLPFSFTLDTVTPDVGAVNLAYAPSTLAATAGTVTATVTLGANAAIGDTLTLSVAGASASPAPVVLSTADIQSGTVSFTINQATLTTGTSYSASAQIADAAGNTSTTVTSAALAFDNVVAAPTGLALATDSGTPGDLLTNNAALAALTGVEAGATVEYSVDGGAWGAYTAPASDGQHNVVVHQIDAAGNISAASAPLTFTLDTIVATPAISLVTDTGVADGITSNVALNAPTGVEAGALVEYSVDGGNWAATYTAPTVDGAHTVSVRQTDLAGNISTPSTPLAFTLDTIALAPGVALNLDSGTAGDGLTNNAALAALTGIEAGAVVEYNLNGAGWASSYTAPTSGDGTAASLYSLQVRQTDVAGNMSPASTLAFTLDTVAPVALTVALVNDSADPNAALGIQGTQLTDTLTNDPTPNFVPESVGNLVEYSTDGINNWQPLSALAPGGLADGTYSLFVRETDAAGNVTTSATGTYNFTLDTVATAPTLALNAPVVAGGVTYSQTGSFWDPLNGLLTGGNSTSSVTDAHPSTQLFTYTDVTTNTPITTDLVGMQTYLLGLSGLITTGVGIPVSIQAQESDAAGNLSPLSAPLSFVYDSMTPAPVVGLATDSGRLNDVTTNQPTFTLLATEANTTHAYSFDGVNWTSIPTLVNGTFTPNAPLVDANGVTLPLDASGNPLLASPTPFNFWVQQIDAAGNVGTFPTTFMMDNFVAAPTVQATDSTGAWVGSGTLVSSGTLTLTGELSLAPTYQVSTDNGITWVDSSIYTPTAMGANNLLVHQIDDAGNTSAATAFNLNLQGTAITGGLPSPDGASPYVTPTGSLLPHLGITDTGASATDHITNNAAISLVAAQPTFINDAVVYSLDGGLNWLPSTGFTPAQGLNTLLVKESCLAGATTHETPVIPMSFTLDTTFPTAGGTANNIAELFTSVSSGLSTAVVRVTYNEAVSVNVNSLVFSGGAAVGSYSSSVVTSGASFDGGVSLGVQPDGSTVVEVRLAETALHAFTTAQVAPSVTLMVTDLAGNVANVPIAVTNNPTPVFADWTPGMLP